jgi:hypothetical protein
VARPLVGRVERARVDRVEGNGQQLAHAPTVLRVRRPPSILPCLWMAADFSTDFAVLSTDNSQCHPLSLHRVGVVPSDSAYGAARWAGWWLTSRTLVGSTQPVEDVRLAGASCSVGQASMPGLPVAPYVPIGWRSSRVRCRGRRHAVRFRDIEEPVISTASVLIHEKEFASWR